MPNATLQTVIDTFLKSADLPTARTNLGVGAADNVQHASVTAHAYIVTSNAIITDAGTSRVLSASDNGKTIVFSSSSAITVTVPAGLGAGFSCGFIQAGTGAITFTASGTTLNATGGLLTTSAQHSLAAILATAANVFNVAIGGGGGAAVTDGDKGDVTISGSGATYTVDNDAITYAKIQNASAGNVVLARAAATSGDYSEVAVGASQLFGRGATGDLTAIMLGTNLSMSGTTLNASGGGVSDGDKGDVTISGSGATYTVDSIQGCALVGAANELNLRNGTNAQTLRIYQSYTDASNYSYLYFNYSTGLHWIGAWGVGTGASNTAIRIDGPAGIRLQSTGGGLDMYGSAYKFHNQGGTYNNTLWPVATGVLALTGDNGGYDTNFGRLCLGPANVTTAPAIKANGAILEARLADDSAYANVRAAGYQTGTEVVVNDTGTALTLTDSHNGKTIICTNASAIAVTINTGLVAGFRCEIIQGGAGAVSVNNGTATKQSRGNLYTTNGQHAKIEVRYVASNTYNISGDRV